MLEDLPVLGICGWSKTGKTTLIEQLVPRLGQEGLDVAVVKHDAHRIDVDRPGTDSHRLFEAGADVLLHDPQETLLRCHRSAADDPVAVLGSLAGRYDLVLVEGHKRTGIPKLWLAGEGDSSPLPDVQNVLAVLPSGDGRLAAALPLVLEHVAARWQRTPVFGCILLGQRAAPAARSARRPNDDLERSAGILAQVAGRVVLVGEGDVPAALSSCARLPCAPDAPAPIAGLLAALRWARHASWLVTARDQPAVAERTWQWLLSCRRPGVWALQTQSGPAGPVQPLPAYCDFRIRSWLESRAMQGSLGLAEIASCPKAVTLAVPDELGQDLTDPSDGPGPAAP